MRAVRRYRGYGAGRTVRHRTPRRLATAPDRCARRCPKGTGRRYGAGGEDGNFVAACNRWSAAMPQPNDLSRSLVALDQNSTIIAVIEMSQSSWLVAGMLPGIERQPRKKLDPSPERLLGLLHRWQDEAVRAGRTITRIALAFEAGRDGFWLARWLAARGVEAHVIHASSVAVSREHRRGENRPARHRVAEAQQEEASAKGQRLPGATSRWNRGKDLSWRPGAIHLTNGLYDAKFDGAPVLALTGLTFHDLIGIRYQQDLDTVRLMQEVALYNT